MIPTRPAALGRGRPASPFFFALLLLLLLCLPTDRAAAAPDSDLWERWLAHDPDSTATIDHSAWNELLARYVVRDPVREMYLFDYGAVTEADKRRLDAYIAGLADIAISEHNRDQQFAYWVNLYNALTVDVVLDHYPVDTIRDIDISPGWFAAGPWGAELVTIEGEPVTLDDIEHRILRPIWRDPRIHYVVNCAAIGCPQIYPEAYVADELESMLDRAGRDYVNHPRGVNLQPNHPDDVRDYSAILSKIYKWYEEDFGDDDADVLAHVRQFADPELAAALEMTTGVIGYVYDWSLNDAGSPLTSAAGIGGSG